MNEVREQMEVEMLDIMSKMATIDSNSEEYAKLSKQLVEIGKIRNESLKIECDYERQAEREDTEAETKMAELELEKKHFKINTILECGKIGASLLLFIGLAVAESRGTFTNMSTKDLFKGMRFGIKK